MMMPRAPSVVVHPLVLRLDWEILVRLACRRSKPPNIDVGPTPSSSVDFVAQPINWSSLNFETQNKKLSRWFWGPNHKIGAPGFKARPRKPSTLVLKLNKKTHAPRLQVHGTDCTRHHPAFQLPGHLVPDLCLTIPDHLQQVSYFYHDTHRCPLCRTCHLHTTRQENTILHMK
jgi:hypothetical protein